jgi:hypothetical protein
LASTSLVVADNINDRGEIAGGLALPGVTPQQADAGETHVLIAEIDRNKIVRGKYALDVVGHYAGPTFFSFM